MGTWVFMRTTYSPMSGYTSGWCDVPHWGLVLTGDLALNWEGGVELLTAGDVYYCPAGPPGHQFQVPDAATTIDYTPLERFDTDDRVMEWRRAALRRAEESGAIPSGRRPRVPAATGSAPAHGNSSTTAPEADPDAGAGFAAIARLRGLVPGRLTVSGLVTAPTGAGRLGVRWVRGARSRRGRRSSA